MKFPKLILVLILSICLLDCAFQENRDDEKKLTVSVNNFHSLFNQEKFEQIYEDADQELKNEFSEQQFVSYLEVVKKDDVDKLKEVPQIWIEYESSNLFGKKIFSNSITVYTEKNIYIEYFEWKLTDDNAKLVSYEIRESSNARGKVIID